MTKTTKRALLLTAAALSLTFAQVARAQETEAPAAETPAVAPDADMVIATVNGENITLGHVIAARLSLPDQYQQLPAEVLFPGLVEQLIQQTVLGQAAGEVNRRAQVQIDNEKRAILATEKLDEIITGAVTDEKIQALYDAEYANAEPTQEWNASHILVETEDEAKALVDELNNGADFAELAKEKSTGPSGPNGGELGWFGPGMMVAPFEDAVKGLEVGSVSAPVQTQFGWHVIKLNEMRDRPAPSVDEVHDEIVAKLQDQAVEEAINSLMDGATIERTDTAGIDPNVLNNLGLLD